MLDQALPGMPDVLARVPPKASEYAALTLDEAVDRAHVIVDRAVDRWPAERVFVLFSGGGDSSILAHLMRERVHEVIHVRTGVSIPATWTYVQAVCAAWGQELHPAYPDDSYEALVMGRVLARTGRNKGKVVHRGFPGPAMHYLMYQRLKERALERVRREVVRASGRKRGRSGQILYLGGMRWAESDRRFINAEEEDPWGAVTWVSPIVWWTEGHMREYRDRQMCHENHIHAEHRLCRPGALPLSEVSANLHMSGDCLCGAFAKPGELEEVAFFYPEVADGLRRLEAQARDAGIDRCIWGEGKRPKERVSKQLGKLCSRCVPELDGQESLVDGWLTRGLITEDLHDRLKEVTIP